MTERVRVIASVVVLATRCTGRGGEADRHPSTRSRAGGSTLGVGVGGRARLPQPGRLLVRRHARLDERVAELKRLWVGEPPFEADPVGRRPVAGRRSPILASPSGRRPVPHRWADSVTGFQRGRRGRRDGERSGWLARRAWRDAGRTGRPQGPTAASTCSAGRRCRPRRLRVFAARYLGVFGPGVRETAFPPGPDLETGAALHEVLDSAEAEGLRRADPRARLLVDSTAWSARSPCSPPRLRPAVPSQGRYSSSSVPAASGSRRRARREGRGGGSADQSGPAPASVRRPPSLTGTGRTVGQTRGGPGPPRRRARPRG